jgi:hypothetical protein
MMAYPTWLSAEDYPWCCVRSGQPRLLETTEACRECPGWQRRDKPGAAWADSN